MYAKRILMMLMVTIAMGAMTARVNAQSTEKTGGAQSSEAGQPSPLGTWRVVTTFPDGFRSNSLETFAPGATADAGVVFSTSDIDLTPPVPCANQQGVYSLGTGLGVHTTFEGFCYNSNSEPFGRLKIQQTITLGRLGKGFAGKAHVQIIRNDGSIEFETDVTMHGMRMNVEPLP